MSQQKALLREIARAINENEPYRIDEWFTEDFKLVEPTKPDWPRGHEGASKLLALFRTLTPPLNYVALDMVEEADRVAVRWQLRRLESGWAIFVEAQRHSAGSYPPNTFPDVASALLDAERRAQFEEAGGHYESSYFLTFLYLPPAEGTAKAERLLYEATHCT